MIVFFLVIALLAFVAYLVVNRGPRILRVLIRVDVQNDFCPGGALPVAEGDQVVPVLNRLSRLAVPRFFREYFARLVTFLRSLPVVGPLFWYYDLVVDTQDSHPEDHGSFATQHPGMAAFAETVLNGIKQVLWPVHCVLNSWGWEFHPGLDRTNVAKTVLKGRDRRVDSYSGFFDNGRGASAAVLSEHPYLGKTTGLAEYLFAEAERRNVDEIELHVGGLAFRYCVSFTGKDGRSLTWRGKQLRVRLIEDGMRAIVFAPGDYEREVADLKALGIEFTTSAEVEKEAA